MFSFPVIIKVLVLKIGVERFGSWARLFSQFFVNVMGEECPAKFATEVWIGWPVTRLELQLSKKVLTRNLFESPAQHSCQILARLRRHSSAAPWFSILLNTAWGKISKYSWQYLALRNQIAWACADQYFHCSKNEPWLWLPLCGGLGSRRPHLNPQATVKVSEV